ncbi:hypothetical protein HYH02_013813 [Chlamydomonas schloesseri]|uniref:Protein kinase domain-containing protein n=1 Tax=Chlamydomonas schloesseri TaxID=2026947 RepID=A0A835SS12_9CHLO|nr:hypothetical protein HYH02_013813 [Chlamydomonas schloesseri]|eukprot:KAG2430337.1 hypothetical protein HYH02_013813 [Chlamydomonas schloesseri]
MSLETKDDTATQHISTTGMASSPGGEQVTAAGTPLAPPVTAEQQPPAASTSARSSCSFGSSNSTSSCGSAGSDDTVGRSSLLLSDDGVAAFRDGAEEVEGEEKEWVSGGSAEDAAAGCAEAPVAEVITITDNTACASPPSNAEEAPAAASTQREEAAASDNEEGEYYEDDVDDGYYENDEDYYSDDNEEGEEEAPAPMSTEETKAYLAAHGLDTCVTLAELGTGGFGAVSLVEIKLPDGTLIKAARKVLNQNGRDGGLAALRAALQRELDGLAAAEGCEHAVQCLGHKMPTEEGEPAELLLTYSEGGSVAGLLSTLAHTYMRGLAEAPERKRSGKNKYKYEQLPYPGSTLMDEQDMRSMLRALVLSIKHMAARGYLHCDLKPANVLFDYAPDGSKVFRVCDFNLATRMGSDGSIPRAPGGTFGYCAWETHCQLVPIEQPRPHSITLAADIASAGLTLAAATGLHSLAGGTLAYLEYERDLPRRTPPALKELIEWMVAVDPSQRPSPDQVLAHRWMAGEQ